MPMTGIVGTSRKEHERRVPIHPDHFVRIPADLQPFLVLERGYGKPFDVADDQLAPHVGRFVERDEVIGTSDVVVLPKPEAEDLRAMKIGATHWGWPHCVQQRDIAQAAIDRRLTLLAFEAMYNWDRRQRGVHIFCMNNELAGYCGVFDALRRRGQDGHYGPQRRAVILSLGSVSRGAAHALFSRGYHDLTIVTQRPPYLVQNPLFGRQYAQLRRAAGGCGRLEVLEADGTYRPLIDVLSEADVIVNGILQDTDNPLMFVQRDEVDRLKRGCLIIDISCDCGMGFPFAQPTTFAKPTIRIGAITYYAVDHTPSYLWDSASWNISEALLPHLATVMGGAQEWAKSDTISGAIEIQDGVVRNRKILTFQNRAAEYPHDLLHS